MYDVIVIGVGSMGSSACYHLAKRGARVLGIEQFGITHENGSHTGQSRLIRKAYFEHPDYVPLLNNTYNGWAEIEKESNQQLYWETGITYFGLPDCEMLKGVKKSAELYDIQIHRLTHDQIKEKYPQFDLPKEYIGLLEPEAGLLTPEPAIQVLVELAKKCGAKIHINEQVLDWNLKGDYVKVMTNKSSYLAKKIIFTAGAFSENLIKTKAPLKVTQQFMGWTIPLNESQYTLGKMPCWMISEEEMEGPYYGFPELNFKESLQGMKIAYHRKGDEVIAELDLDSLENAEQAILNGLIRKYFPNLKTSILTVKRCKYTYSPDHDFIVDRLSEFDNRVLIAAGFSGHGFKFVPVIGESLADLALNGETDLPIDFLGLSRFNKNSVT